MTTDGRPDPTTEQEHTMDSTSTSATDRPAGSSDDTAPWAVDGTATGSTGDTASSAAPAATPAPERGVRVGTVVWGLVVAAVGVGLAALAAGVVFDVQLAFIVLVALAGVGLVIGSVVSAGRRRSSAAGRA
ncbi:hypothetical protein [Cellulomonas carbonis]|uniref:Uncharacterized protein n=1 Tax=Cellulomonas carbonis T26 TaxID=947969 RepID=A0A0A0BPF3_9CELL|nr:hypothetical protein [Cellulomonas carbonis]KGM09830.1 hypothetical protein N868_18590 [Cellulomonas carbonis T26]GGC17075.1 hypothetical protein GCM10010972_32980 [Cellulomonas carbonis]